MRKFTLFLVSLFLTVGAMAQTPILTIENPDLSNGPVELTAEQVSIIRDCDNQKVTIIADVTLTDADANSVLFGAITDCALDTETLQSNIIGLGTGGSGYRIHAGTSGSYFWTKNSNAGTAVANTTKKLIYIVEGSKVTVYAEDFRNTYVNIAKETSNIFSDNFDGENSKFYLGGVKYNTAGEGKTYASFAGTINNISFYNDALTSEQLLAVFKGEVEAFFSSFEGLVGFPKDNVIQAQRDVIYSATNYAGIKENLTSVYNALYNATDINLPVDGGTYTFTFIHLDGEKYYVNCTGSALALVKLEEGAAIPYTAMFRTYLNEDGTYAVRTYNNKYIRYTNSNGGVATEDNEYTKVSFDKMLKSGNYVSANNDALFGLMRIRSKRDNSANPTGTFVAKRQNNNGTYSNSFDGSTGYHFENRSNTISYTTAVSIERVDVPVYGNYYRLQGNSGNYVDAVNNYSGTQMGLKSVNEYSASGTIFYFDRDMTMINYATGTAIYDTRCIAQIGTAGNPWAFFPSTSHEGKFKVINVSNQYYLHDNEGNRADRCDRDPEGHADTHSWTIEKVTSLPVTITSAGWATFYAPVAVKVADGVTAYAVTINGNWATLTAIEGGVIPANTGVVLQGAANTYNFAVTNTTATVDSDLTGTVAATYITDDAYVLTADNTAEAGVCFGKATKNQQSNASWLNNSHKAYLPAPVGANAASYSFRFEGGTTGVEEVKTENGEVKAIYDLTGRQVNAVERGIYIINGKKVLVK